MSERPLMSVGCHECGADMFQDQVVIGFRRTPHLSVNASLGVDVSMDVDTDIFCDEECCRAAGYEPSRGDATRKPTIR